MFRLLGLLGALCIEKCKISNASYYAEQKSKERERIYAAAKEEMAELEQELKKIPYNEIHSIEQGEATRNFQKFILSGSKYYDAYESEYRDVQIYDRLQYLRALRFDKDRVYFPAKKKY